MSVIFLSHRSADNAAALALKQRLASHGYEAVFLDFDPERGIAAGREGEQERQACLPGENR